MLIIGTVEFNNVTNPLYNNIRYTHLLPEDIPVWERFLKSQDNIYSHFDYDVRVGEGRDPGSKFNEKDRELAILLSQRRIDAVGYHVSHFAIIEITRSAGLKALGQLTAYPVLYRLKFKPNLSLKPILVCEELQPDTEDAYLTQRITILRYPG